MEFPFNLGLLLRILGNSVMNSLLLHSKKTKLKKVNPMTDGVLFLFQICFASKYLDIAPLASEFWSKGKDNKIALCNMSKY